MTWRATSVWLLVAVPWRHGDVMLLDNMQVMHSRETFVGPRRQVLTPVPFIIKLPLSCRSRLPPLFPYCPLCFFHPLCRPF